MTEASQGRKPEDAAEEDLRLIERVLGGDRQAFEALVRSHERRVFRVTLAVLGQVEDAEDRIPPGQLQRQLPEIGDSENWPGGAHQP